MEKQDIRKIKLDDLRSRFVEMGEPRFRANQVYQWLWKQHCLDFGEMTNLSKDLRNKLEESYTIPQLGKVMHQQSVDGTIKAAFELNDGNNVEGVMIPTDTRKTACVSSQVGCTLNCYFCATGKLKRMRNLEAYEIYDQVVELNRLTLENHDKGLSNIVFMGMGEPLLNYDNVMLAISMICDEKGMAWSSKRITLSTVGVVRGIKRLAQDKVRFNLALSLHAPDNEKRSRIMDINKNNKIEDLIEALNLFYAETKNKITFEYILFNKFNDTEKDAQNLAKIARRVPSFVNLIEYNSVEGVDFQKSTEERKQCFIRALENHGIVAKVRKSRGEDIDAACGQLANKLEA